MSLTVWYFILCWLGWGCYAILGVTYGIKYKKWNLSTQEGICNALPLVCPVFCSPITIPFLFIAGILYCVFFLLPQSLAKISFKKETVEQKIEKLKIELEKMGVEV